MLQPGRLFRLIVGLGSRALTPAMCHLQVIADPLYLVDEEVDVRLGGRRVGDDHTEEVDLIGLWLVAHHGGP